MLLRSHRRAYPPATFVARRSAPRGVAPRPALRWRRAAPPGPRRRPTPSAPRSPSPAPRSPSPTAATKKSKSFEHWVFVNAAQIRFCISVVSQRYWTRLSKHTHTHTHTHTHSVSECTYGTQLLHERLVLQTELILLRLQFPLQRLVLRDQSLDILRLLALLNRLSVEEIDLTFNLPVSLASCLTPPYFQSGDCLPAMSTEDFVLIVFCSTGVERCSSRRNCTDKTQTLLAFCSSLFRDSTESLSSVSSVNARVNQGSIRAHLHGMVLSVSFCAVTPW